MKKNIFIIIIMFIIIISIVAIINFKKLETKSFNNVEKNRSQEQLILSSNNEKNEAENIWCATFKMAWEELTDYFGRKIAFDNKESILLNQLNENNFGLNSISEEDYYIKVEKSNFDINLKINEELKNKFNTTSEILNKMNFTSSNGIVIYSYLNKKYTFKYPFKRISTLEFLDKDGNIFEVEGFMLGSDSKDKIIKNINNTYIKDYNNFYVELKTKENEEIILIMTENIEDEFENIWSEYQNNKKNYENKFVKGDVLEVPCININYTINYDELCGETIKNGNGEYIEYALQNIRFSLNETGGFLENETLIKTDAMSSSSSKNKFFSFNKPFILFIKEQEKDFPYFALKVYDEAFLIKK